MKNAGAISILVFCIFLLQVSVVAGAEHLQLQDTQKFKEAVYLLETWINAVLDYDRLPGISIAIVHDQELVYAKGFGYADVEARLRATPDTYYSICSISKMFTAIALLQLRDEGKLNLADPVSKYLTWFTPEMASPDSPPPKLRDLLRHTGGLPCEPDHTIWSDRKQLYPSHEEFIKRVSHIKMSYPANTQFNYSNAGYALLGEIISVVSNMDYADYIRQNIIDPLKMKDTAPYRISDLRGSEAAEAYSRQLRSGSRVKFPPVDQFEEAMSPAGGLGSTVRDMAKFAMWQFRVLDGADNTVLKKDTLKEMQSEQWPGPKWGLGFAIWNMDEKEIVGHQGGCPGFKSQIILSPEDKIAVVVMVNATDAPQFTLAMEACNIIASALGTSSDEEVGSKSGEWQKYIGYYTADRTWSDAEVLEWNGSLSVLWVPNGNPNPIGALVKLRHIESGIFREVKRDGTLGKHYAFGTDSAGNTFMKFNNNVLKKTLR